MEPRPGFGHLLGWGRGAAFAISVLWNIKQELRSSLVFINTWKSRGEYHIWLWGQHESAEDLTFQFPLRKTQRLCFSSECSFQNQSRQPVIVKKVLCQWNHLKRFILSFFALWGFSSFFFFLVYTRSVNFIAENELLELLFTSSVPHTDTFLISDVVWWVSPGLSFDLNFSWSDPWKDRSLIDVISGASMPVQLTCFLPALTQL